MSADRGILDRPAPDPDADLRYGELGHQRVDLFLPPAPPSAWVFLVHGGFWRAEWDRTHLRPLASALRDQGYGVALVEYARSGMPSGGWPGTFDDVAAGLAALRRYAHDQDAGERPDPDAQAGVGPGPGPRIVLVGHSAGGHLATWLLHQSAAAPGPAPVAGAVSLAGCLDLSMVARLHLDDDAAADLMGGSPDEVPARYEAGDPARLGRTPYPMVVVHGTEDEQVPEAVADAWWEAAGTPGRDVDVRLEGVGHFPLIDSSAPPFAVLTQHLARLSGRP